MVEKTRLINQIYIDDEQFEMAWKKQKIIQFQEVINELAIKFYNLFESGDVPLWKPIREKNLYYIHVLNLIVADTKRMKIKKDDYAELPGLPQNNITEKDARYLFSIMKNENPLIDFGKGWIETETIENEKCRFNAILTQEDTVFYFEEDYYSKASNPGAIKLPTHYISTHSEKNDLFDFFVKNDLCVFDEESDSGLFKLIVDLYESKYLNYKDSIFSVVFCDNSLHKIECFLNSQKKKEILGISFDDDSLKNQISQWCLSKEDSDYRVAVEKLLSCDAQRIHMERYPEHILTDPESGHWDLWVDKENNHLVSLKDNLVARNPVYDALCNKSGVVGIDFGTKSTVVTYRQSTADVMPMRIGSGQYSRTVTMSDYENPTVMEIRNIEDFMVAYKSKIGRPDTKWDDLLISHEAFSQLLQEQRGGDTFASFFSELKQWAADKERQVTLRDANGVKINIPPYMELGEENFDPIEIYAYYIGLFINNMHNKVYLRYKLSFPAKAEKQVRDKILASFERGIKKSLPIPVLNSEECMRVFRVEQGASEPAAYAICALQEFGFEPEEDEQVYYGIFDFGGGTTDFDFGVWSSEVDDDNYDYKISRFGEGEDPYLGGENILGMLAYEVLLNNYDNLLMDNIIFIKPYGAKTQVGKDWLVRQDSQYAHFNSKRLMEKLRGVWENDEEIRTLFAGGTIQVALFDKDGKVHNNYSLAVNLEKLDALIRERIESGVSQFFSTLKNSFDEGISLNKIYELSELNIFLAGNSCKSQVVLDVFKEHIDSLYEDMGCGEEQKWIKVYPPLGSVQAEKIQNDILAPNIDEILDDVMKKKKTKTVAKEESDQTISLANSSKVKPEVIGETEIVIERIKRPNGKTGVAFGLLDNKVRIVQNEQDESRFRFYLGQNRKKKFRCVIDKDKQPYGIWKRFCSASVDTFDIWFTRSADAPSNSLDITSIGIYSEPGFIKEPDDASSVFIRLISPTEIEYMVSNLDENQVNEKDVTKNSIERLLLQEKE